MNKNKTKILWLSKHEPLPKQLDMLKQKIGDYLLIKQSGWYNDVSDLFVFVNRLGVEYIIPVLPLSMIARLVNLANKHNITVLWSQMIEVNKGYGTPPTDIDRYCQTILTMRNGMWKVVEFDKFFVIKGVNLVLEDF